jgi:hypothetical protein
MWKKNLDFSRISSNICIHNKRVGEKHIVETISKADRKIVETGKIDTSNTHIYIYIYTSEN